MITVNNITSDYKQKFNIRLDNGYKLSLSLEYKDNQKAWFYSLTYNTFQLTNQKLVAGISLLYQFKHVLDIDITVWSLDGFDPIFIDDFTNNRCGIEILDRAEADYLSQKYLVDNE